MATKLTDVFAEKRDIVVTIPKSKRAEIEAEEADVARREEAGEKDILYFWEMGRLPKTIPRRIYFAWDDAVRAYHDCVSSSEGRLYMRSEIHEIVPDPIGSFRGFRYYKQGERK